MGFGTDDAGWAGPATPPEVPPGHVSTGVEEGRAFMVGLLIGVGISVVIVLGVFLAVLLTL